MPLRVVVWEVATLQATLKVRNKSSWRKEYEFFGSYIWQDEELSTSIHQAAGQKNTAK